MTDWLSLRAAATPEDEALVDADSGETWTFETLDAETEATAAALAGHGVAAGDRVAVVSETRPAFVRLVFAVQRLGGALVALNARLAPPELARQCAVTDPALVVCEAATADAAREAAGDRPLVSVDGAAVRAFDAARGEVAASPLELGDVAALLFTSGTTGDPKAVALTHGNFLASAGASAFRLGLADDRWLCPLSLYHTGGLSVVLRSVLYGTTAVLQRQFDATVTRETLAARDCTAVSVVPTMLRRLLDDGPLPDSLRFVLLGGAPTPPSLVERCAERDVPVCPTYGMTETASQIATARPEEAVAHSGTVGRPLFGTRVTVVDDDGDVRPRGETGELAVAGPTVTPGYVGGETPTCDHGLLTGDVGHRDESGRLWVHGRRPDRIVTGGENVDPGAVAAVLRDHAAVRDAAVVGLDDEEWGERVAALVTGDADPDGLRAFCATRLAAFEVPKTVAVVDALPRTASGTVDREAARERLREAED